MAYVTRAIIFDFIKTGLIYSGRFLTLLHGMGTMHATTRLSTDASKIVKHDVKHTRIIFLNWSNFTVFTHILTNNG